MTGGPDPWRGALCAGWWGTDAVYKPLGKRYVPVTVKFKKQVRNSVYRAMLLFVGEGGNGRAHVYKVGCPKRSQGNPDIERVVVFVRGSWGLGQEWAGTPLSPGARQC